MTMTNLPKQAQTTTQIYQNNIMTQLQRSSHHSFELKASTDSREKIVLRYLLAI